MCEFVGFLLLFGIFFFLWLVFFSGGGGYVCFVCVFFVVFVFFGVIQCHLSHCQAKLSEALFHLFVSHLPASRTVYHHGWERAKLKG